VIDYDWLEQDIESRLLARKRRNLVAYERDSSSTRGWWPSQDSTKQSFVWFEGKWIPVEITR